MLNLARVLSLGAEVVEKENVSEENVDRTLYSVRTARNGNAIEIAFKSWGQEVRTLVRQMKVLWKAHLLAVLHDSMDTGP
jgi:hypothetical protein